MIRLPARSLSGFVFLYLSVAAGMACNLQPVKDDGPHASEETVNAAKKGDGSSGSSGSSNGANSSTEDPSQPSVGGCAFGEPNEDRDHATKLRFGQPVKKACATGSGDVDWYELDVPADPAGGYVQITAKNITAGRWELRVFAASDNEQLLASYAESQKADVNAFVEAKPGTKLRFSLKPSYYEEKQTFEYDVDVKYTKIADAFEPNDSRENAKRIEKNTSINAYFFAGYDSKELGDYDDFYEIDLNAGKATFKLEDVAEGYAKMNVLDEAGESIEIEYAGTRGASVFLNDLAITKSGKHYVHVTLSGVDAEGDTTGVPPHFTKPYKLTVSQ